MGEWTESHIAGAMHIPIHDLLGRIAEVPNAEVWVHCAAGYRATAAASILTARGARVVVVNDSYAEQAAASGLPLITAPLERGEAVA